MTWLEKLIQAYNLWRERILEGLMSYLPTAHFGLIIDMVFGQIIPLPPTVYHQLKIIGMLHIVAASGYNIGLVSGLIDVVAARFGRLWRFLIWSLLMIFYLLLTDLSVSILRAALMFGLKMGAENLVHRLYHNFISLATASLVILLFRPWLLASISFQLSVGACVGLAIFAERPKPHDSATEQINWQWWRREIVELLITSLAAQVFTLPIIYWHFGEITIFAVVANVMLLWLAPILTIGGLMFFAAGAILSVIPAVAGLVKILAGFLWFYSNLFLQLADWLNRWPIFNLQLRALPAWFWILYLVISAGIYYKLKHHHEKEHFSLARFGFV